MKALQNVFYVRKTNAKLVQSYSHLSKQWLLCSRQRLQMILYPEAKYAKFGQNFPKLFI